jgi:hypothetical protein
MRQLLERSPPNDINDLLDEAARHFDDELTSAVPERLWLTLLERLINTQRWQQLDEVGRAALATSTDETMVLRMLLRGALQSGQPEAAEWADRLAPLSHSSPDGLLIARALLVAGRIDDAERVVRGALARAVESEQKVALHLTLAEVAQRKGNINEAALEQKRAADLRRH